MVLLVVCDIRDDFQRINSGCLLRHICVVYNWTEDKPNLIQGHESDHSLQTNAQAHNYLSFGDTVIVKLKN